MIACGVEIGAKNMTNNTGSSNPWFSGKRKSGDELTPPEKKTSTTENDLMATRRLVGAPDENDGRNRWFGVRQSYTNLPAHKLINDLQNGRYDPYASIDNVRSRSLDHMDKSQFEKQMPFTTPTMWAKRDEATYVPPYIEDISNDWTVNTIPPNLTDSSISTSAQSASAEPFSMVPEINPMAFVQKYGSELPTETLEDLICEQNTEMCGDMSGDISTVGDMSAAGDTSGEFGCDDFSPVEETQKQPDNENLYFLRNAANRLPAFRKPPRSLT